MLSAEYPFARVSVVCKAFSSSFLLAKLASSSITIKITIRSTCTVVRTLGALSIFDLEDKDIIIPRVFTSLLTSLLLYIVYVMNI